MLKGEVLKIAYGVCILVSLWHLWADFWWPQLCVASDLIHLLILQSHVVFMLYILKIIHVLLIIIWNIYVLCLGVRVYLQGLTCACMASCHCVGLYMLM